MGHLLNFTEPEIADGIVATFDDLPDPGTTNGQIWIVKQTTGIVFVNRKRSGLYLSDGASWTRLAENNSFLRTAASSGNDNRILKSDGVGGNGSQETGIIVDDSNNVSGIETLTATSIKVSDSFVAGESITAGDIVYLNADEKIYKAFATGTIEESCPLGFAQSSVSADETVTVVMAGIETNLVGLSGGAIYYLAATAGNIVTVPPAGVGDNIVKVGVGVDGENLHIATQYIYTKG